MKARNVTGAPSQTSQQEVRKKPVGTLPNGFSCQPSPASSHLASSHSGIPTRLPATPPRSNSRVSAVGSTGIPARLPVTPPRTNPHVSATSPAFKAVNVGERRSSDPAYLQKALQREEVAASKKTPVSTVGEVAVKSLAPLGANLPKKVTPSARMVTSQKVPVSQGN